MPFLLRQYLPEIETKEEYLEECYKQLEKYNDSLTPVIPLLILITGLIGLVVFAIIVI